MKKFWIYHNFVHHFSAIHRAECLSYSCGKGRANLSPEQRENDEWIACSSFADAQKKASRLGRGEPKYCSFCRPERKETPKELAERLKKVGDENRPPERSEIW